MKLRRRPHLAGGILKGWSHSEKAKMFSVDADLCLRKTQAGKYHDHRNVIESEKCRFQMFSSTVKRAPAPVFNSKSSGLESVFEKFRFRDGLLRTAGLTVETDAVFKFLRCCMDAAFS